MNPHPSWQYYPNWLPYSNYYPPPNPHGYLYPPYMHVPLKANIHPYDEAINARNLNKFSMPLPNNVIMSEA